MTMDFKHNHRTSSPVTIIGSLVLIVILIQSGCTHNPVDAAFGNPREYAWTIDTLAYPDPGSSQTLLKSIWASSEHDVFVVGHNDLGTGNMYHFDGHSWSPVKLLQHYGGTLSSVGDFEDIIGFSDHDVYAVGSKYSNAQQRISMVLHYDGVRWQDISVVDDVTISSIWGASNTNLLFGTQSKEMFRYDGNNYKLDSVQGLPQTAQGRICEMRSIVGNDPQNLYLLISSAEVTSDRSFLVTGRPGGWTIQDSTHDFVSRLWLSPSGKLYRAGAGVSVRDGSTWRVLLTQLSAQAIAGTSDANVIAVGSSGVGGQSGVVYHYDGNSWLELHDLHLANVMYAGIWMNESSVFIAGWLFGTTQKTVVARGTLKK